MKIKLFILFLFSSSLYFSQIWIDNLEQAKKLAKSTNKLVILDFTANWCQPCKMMEREYWYNNKYKNSLNSFIAVSIDLDSEKQIASFYGVKSIPNVKVIDYQGNVIHESLGFVSGEVSDKEFGGFPSDVSLLYEMLDIQNMKNPTDEQLIELASSYQAMVQKSTNNKAQLVFANFSNKYLNKCIKHTKDPDFFEKANLAKAFNNVLTNNAKRVLKTLDITKITDSNRLFALYVLLNASYSTENHIEAEKWLAEIEKTGKEDWIRNAQKLKAKYSK